MSPILTLVLALIGAVGASVATGLLTRPQMKANAGAQKATGEVALSSDARAWAETFRKEAADAKAEAAAAKAEATAARAEAADCEERMDALDDRFHSLLALTRDALRLLRALDEHTLSRLQIPADLADELGLPPSPRKP